MRAVVVFFGGAARDRVAEIARGVASGIERQGHDVDLVDGDRDVNTRLTRYDYIAVGTVAVSLFRGRIDGRIREFLSGSGSIGAKKGFAFVARRTFGSQRALQNLMGAMEHEGMFLRFSEVLRSREEAAAIAERLRVDS